MNAVASRNVKFISHSDQGGRGDGVQIMVHRGYAYCRAADQPAQPEMTPNCPPLSSMNSSGG
jgi:hypothetical protein